MPGGTAFASPTCGAIMRATRVEFCFVACLSLERTKSRVQGIAGRTAVPGASGQNCTRSRVPEVWENEIVGEVSQGASGWIPVPPPGGQRTQPESGKTSCTPFELLRVRRPSSPPLMALATALNIHRLTIPSTSMIGPRRREG